MSGFAHLHLHSEYSLLDGACRIKDIPQTAKQAGHSAVALTDHGVMFGVVEFYRACLNVGIKPIIGCEVYVASKSCRDKTHENDAENYHLVLLVKNETGYKNLIRLVSFGYTEGFYLKPRVDLDILQQNSEGLIALSACLGGRIAQYIVNDDIKGAETYAAKLLSVYGENNFYLELQNHGLELQEKVTKGLVYLSEKYNIPLVATNDIHYLKQTDADMHAMLMCIQMNTSITEGRPLGFATDEFYYKTTEEMTDLFGKYKGAIENTTKIADMCNFDFSFDNLYLPRFIPENGLSPEKFLKELTFNGLQKKLDKKLIVYTDEHNVDEYKSRIIYELFIINRMGYNEYFLIVWDFVTFAKTSGIPTGPGRGSGAGSLVAFLIGITDIDSIKYNLLFERFLNPERISMPDFDIDFCYERRDEVIDYVAQRYGRDHVSQIITFGSMSARAVVRDVGRAMGLAYQDVDVVAKAIPQRIGITLAEALDGELKELYENNSSYKNLIDISLALEGMPRHASTHAAGVVITDKPITDYVPLAVSSGTIVTQFNMDTVASLGLLKFDFLALRYLTIISDTEKQIKEFYPVFDITMIPENDMTVYEMLSLGWTMGVFQLESAGMKQLLSSFRPESLEDIMVAIALYRPGPMDAIPRFLENRKNKSSLDYKIPKLRDILDETHGCIIYQEQVMRIFRTLANYSYGKADMIRRAMSRKKQDEMEKEREDFIAGTRKNFIGDEEATELFNEMLGFAKYAFNKSHAASYAVISYRTAYLRCYYPCQYFAALLTSVLGNMPKMTEYIVECGKHNIKVLPPDINESNVKFTVSGNSIRFGMLAIKNLGQNFVHAIIIERAQHRFTSFVNFIARMTTGDMNKRAIESLIKAGAFDCFGIYRSRLLAVYESLIDTYAKKGHTNLQGQLQLFDVNDEQDGFAFPEIAELHLREKIKMEKESAGFCFSGHILDYYSKHMESFNIAEINNVLISFEENNHQFRDKQIITVAGSVSKRLIKQTKSSETMAFISLEDRYAEIELVIFPRVFNKYSAYLVYDSVLVVMGEITLREDELPKILVKDIIPLNDNDVYDKNSMQLPKTSNGTSSPSEINSSLNEYKVKEKKLYLRLEHISGIKYDRVINLLEILEGETQVVFYDNSKREYIKYTGNGADITGILVEELELILGKENVVLK